MNILAVELTRIPNVSLETMLRLARVLVSTRAPGRSEAIDHARIELHRHIEIVHAALLAHMQAANTAPGVSEAFAIDALWVQLRSRLEAARRERPELAQQLIARIFDVTPITELVKQPFVEQVESTATLLRLIDEHGLRSELAELVGAPLLDALDRCMAGYADMATVRLRRERALEHDLSQLRHELRSLLAAYAHAVLALAQPTQPHTVTASFAHLRPIAALRETVMRRGSEAAALDELDAMIEREPSDADQDNQSCSALASTQRIALGRPHSRTLTNTASSWPSGVTK